MISNELVEVDSIEITVVVDNEVDPISPSNNSEVKYVALFQGLPLDPLQDGDPRGDASLELRMDNICCGAHGLSLMITAVKGDKRHTILFDTGPEEAVWEKNAARTRADIASIERIHLSHWHRDHSGGMLRAIRLINSEKGPNHSPVIVDVHPDRPDFRGFSVPGAVVSLEADPSFDEIQEAGGMLEQNSEAHSILENMFLVSGHIPRNTKYELGIKGALRYEGQSGTWTADETISDERLVVCNLKGKGLVVFTGCSHAGVINASRHARELVNSAPLHAVVGGFHLADNKPEKLTRSLEDLVDLDPKVLMPGHCTGYRFKFMIEHALPNTLVPSFAGTKYTL
ncbi:7, 8-dihydropterin-6-methyl-4-(Beta-D-ribofuranosyl)-aminobenzene-5'-phosphate synthase [Pleurostoma richardsiae]|uniref:7, 8-dihydropterin-6-methyl-4-(Beta-D-ribofuranosyl)-aminobenzene-5'-phosphate synthase n=1 Tax=Pleurostoma richardsiae TaxID=41990 RepID=A0AA38VD81_9PEZI|nr:7, 8-dihydropterin-6-methyl-4-(Beta-D-ribofuranosyl)-aminobenzene-5'-phosphate synthase [Pleurostoma richardsiae]